MWQAAANHSVHGSLPNDQEKDKDKWHNTQDRHGHWNDVNLDNYSRQQQ